MKLKKAKNLKKPKTFIAKSTIVIGCILLGTAGTLTIKNTMENRNAGISSEKIINYMENKNNESEYCDNKSNLTDSYSESDKFIEFSGEKYVGILIIPSLKIKLPINKKYSYEQ